MRPAGLALAAALGAVLSGCGGDDEPSRDSIAVRDFEFEPAAFEASPGETVTWDNEGDQIHNVKGDGFFSRAIDPGADYEYEFTKRGTYEYVCTLHPQMTGEVTVR